jgi:2-oxoglutarate ferredoxin oxidoreductase subunit gamma
MRHEEIIFSGFGGQGALFAGQLLAYTGISEGLYVSWIPSYGPEMRGGTANCTVILSEEEIGAPVVSHPTSAVVLNLPSMEKYEPLIKPNGLLIVNQSLVTITSKRDDLRIITIPAPDLATEMGNQRMATLILWRIPSRQRHRLAASGWTGVGETPLRPAASMAEPNTQHWKKARNWPSVAAYL